jgi:broad specificity phosphatase PhoE
MQRALRTAHLAGFPTPRITSLLEEANYGQYEGLTSSQIHEMNPRWDIYHDGSPGGESPAQLYARAQRFISLIDTGQNARLIAFSHGHILRAIAAAWIKADITVAGGLQLDVATVSILRDGDHGRVITLWNAP